MKIFVDADSCPPQIREIVVRAAKREGIETCFIANRVIPLPKEERVRMIVVPKGEGSADERIVADIGFEDIVITRDIPLASRCVEKKALVLNDRGAVYTENNIRERLSLRNIMKDFREAGLLSDGERSFGPREVKSFADAFDRELRKNLKRFSKGT